MNYLVKRRHREIYTLAIMGYSNAEIANIIHVSVSAVKENMTVIFRLCECKTRAKLISKHYRDKYEK